MNKKNFFKNISYVLGFGFVGTCIFLVIYTILSYFVFNFISDSILGNDSNNTFDWKLDNIIHMSVVLIASDTLAPLALIDSEKYPGLFAIVFGEGCMNDAVGLIAFNTVVSIGSDLGGYIGSATAAEI